MSQLDNVITCAVNYASQKNHEYVTLEHLMLCCLEDETVLELLNNFECDVELARQEDVILLNVAHALFLLIINQ